MGAEEHAHRPGWGGGRQMGLDTPPIRLRGRRARLLHLVRGQGPRPRGGEAAPDAAVLVAVRLAHRHGHARRAHIQPAPTCRFSGGVGDALPGKEAEAQKTPNPGGNPGNPRKWARTDESEQPKGRGRGGKGKGKAKGGKPKAGKKLRKTGATGFDRLEPGPGIRQEGGPPRQRPKALGTARALARSRAAAGDPY